MVTFNVKTIKSDRIENKILKWEMVPSFHKKLVRRYRSSFKSYGLVIFK